VSLHAARRAATLDLDLLDKRDYSPVGYRPGTRGTRHDTTPRPRFRDAGRA
jgi:hypothetical protein